MKYVKAVLESDQRSATTGTWTERLERNFAVRFGVKHAIAHNSGTSALHTCLLAAGVGPGDEVISPALTVVMDTFATLYVGATPIYADVDPHTFNIDPANALTKITPRTKAIIAVGLYGLPADVDPLLAETRGRHITVIEDNAQCYLASNHGRLAGTLGDMSIFSFENSKHLSVGEGGIAITDDEDLAIKIRKAAGIGYKNLSADGGRVRLDDDLFQDPDYKRHDSIGWNYRLTEICAAVGVAQLERLEELVAARCQTAAMYAAAIGECTWLIPQLTPQGYTNSYFTYAVRYEGTGAIGVSWRDFRLKYKELGGDGYYAAWSMPYLEPALEHLGLHRGLCPVAESLQPKVMQLKTNYRDLDLAKRKAEALAKTVRYFSS